MFIINSSVSYGEWTVTQEPNCLMTGVRMHTCPLCGKYEHEDIPALGHAFDEIVPLDTGNVFILYTVPEMMKDNTDKPIIAEFTIDGEYYVIKV